MFGIKSKQPPETDASRLWSLYRRGADHHSEAGLYQAAERAFRFYEGEQWGESESGEDKPSYNFIAPIVDYKTSMVSMRQLQIVFSPMEPQTLPEGARICEDLNAFAARHWEAGKLDTLCWRAVREACVAGESFVFFSSGKLDCQLLSGTEVYLGDEQQPDIQRQPYIIIHERRPLEDVRCEARANGLPAEKVEQITPDKDTGTVVGDKTEVKGEGKCSCILCLRRDETTGFIRAVRSTERVIYSPEREIAGLRRYPLAMFVWNRRKNSARGTGVVTPLICNQIEVNRLLSRRLVSAKQNAFAKPVYVRGMIENPTDIDKVGKAVEVKAGSAARVNDIFSYIAPAPMSAEAGALCGELVTLTRELAGAGDAALGQIDPEKASGAAIIASQEQAALPLNSQYAEFSRFVEDIALIWADLWTAYNPGGLEIIMPEADGLQRVDKISAEALLKLGLAVRIDAAPTNPFSRYAREQALAEAKAAGDISFEEYVKALEPGASAPKAAFEQIIAARGAKGGDNYGERNDGASAAGVV